MVILQQMRGKRGSFATMTEEALIGGEKRRGE